jgi:hypothetical protein
MSNQTNITGTSFANAQAITIEEGSRVLVNHEKDNQFDSEALIITFDDEKLGYIAKGTAIYDIDRKEFPKTAKVLSFYRKQEGDKFNKHEHNSIVSCEIKVLEVDMLLASNDVASFNEDLVINFNELSHTYVYNNNVLTGATTYIKKYIEEFDAAAIIPRCEKGWNIPAKKIRAAWDLGRDLAASFGTGIHKSLEFTDLYGGYLKKSGDRCFNIKHPIINKIVNEFYDFFETLDLDGEIFPEALISDVENGICALADRVMVTDFDKKECRLVDYKVNHSFTDIDGKTNFINLPLGINLDGNKLSKLALQLHFQKQMLEKSGWKVISMHALVYDDKWKHYNVQDLDGFDILRGTFKAD